jgi:hypothetical protein
MDDNNNSKQSKSSAWYRQLVLPGRTQSPVVKNEKRNHHDYSKKI